jgi:predicted ATPase
MDPDEVAALAEEVIGTPPGPTLLQALKGAAGNPLFVMELLAALSSEGAIEVREGRAELPQFVLPPSLRLLILRRLGTLSIETIEALRVASILGSSFSLADLSTILARPTSALVSLIQEAVRAGVLAEVDKRLAFRHELVREAVYVDLPVSVRQGLHAQAGRALAAAGAMPSQVAAQLTVGASPGDPEAIQWLRRAAREAVHRAPSAAVGLLERATTLLRSADPARDFVVAELATALAWSGRLTEAEANARELLAREPPAGIEQALRVTLAEAMMARGRAWDALREMEAVTAALPEGDPQRARLLAFAAWTRLYAGDIQMAVAGEREALAVAERHGDEGARSVALCVLGIAAHLLGDVGQAVELGTEAIRTAQRDSTHHLDRYPARLFLGWALMDSDQMAEADRVLG